MNTLVGIDYEGDNAYIKHMSDNRALLQAIKEEKAQGNNGWSACRNFQKIGSIPALEYAKMIKINPDLKDPNKLCKWLESAEGAGYRVAEFNPHRAGNIIIK